MDLNFIGNLVREAESKIVLLVMDGLGGLPAKPGGDTALEAARTPNLDALAKDGICGLHEPVGPGITPGSGPAHLGVFGYDPTRYVVGRGVLAASGIGFDLKKGDIAARGNFCTVDEQGRVTDRRAGRIATEKCRELCGLLKKVSLPGVEVFVEPVKDYRFLLVLRGEELCPNIEDTDPQETGKKPLEPQSDDAAAEKTLGLLRDFIRQAGDILQDQHPANMLLLRGFSRHPDWPRMQDVFGLNPASIAAYPMYRGVSKLIGMEPLDTGESVEEEIGVLKKRWKDFDFFYVHIKKVDSAGEDGNFDKRVSLIEEVDSHIPSIRELGPDVFVVTGDHSTPAVLKSHSWHPVPVLLWSEHCRPDDVEVFGERACLRGALGARFPAIHLMPIALSNAHRLEKFGA